jgi:RNA polymerase sigma factor (sigma-70 family)
MSQHRDSAMDAGSPGDAQGPLGPPIDWAAALAEHERWLRTIVLARMRNMAEAEEVLQEVSLAAVRQAAPIHDRNKVAPWLYRLAVRQCLLYRRKQGRIRKLKDNYADRVRPTEEDSRGRDPLGWLLHDERRQAVRAGLGRLTPRDAEILLLKYTEDWSYAQISAHLGITEAAVETRLHRARARLRKELSDLDTAATKATRT